ncbi:hypothetical protein AC579_3324 [Pseudocercospora musae]|uniref:Uncharacterized protein n=1 Tax=Pseudocercospora musae TaxID=113226 RepID=A0A139GTS2_9PEZI|nr:hypothetical protein AC579_3324 [Pseudocercospora musae]
MASQDQYQEMDEGIDDDELLLILLRNLRNATHTFGEGTPPTESIRTTIEDHLQDMKRRGVTTNLAKARASGSQSAHDTSNVIQKPDDYAQLVNIFANMAIRPK